MLGLGSGTADRKIGLRRSGGDGAAAWHRFAGLLFGLMALILAGVSLVPLALGDPFGNGEGSAGWKPDNDEHTYCFADDYTGENPRDAANRKMENLDNQTRMFDNKVPDCTESTDAKFHIADLVGV